MKISSINLKITNYDHFKNNSPKSVNNQVNFSGAQSKPPLKKCVATKIESIKLQIQMAISDYRWNKLMKQINKDVEQMPKGFVPSRYDFD